MRFAVATSSILLVLSITIIGSGNALSYNHKFTRDFSNSGNSQEIQQDCGNFCTETSSNIINSGSSGLTSPSPTPTPTALTLALQPDSGCLNDTPNGVCTATGFLRTNTGPVARANITFTGTAQLVGGGSIPIANFTPSVLTDRDGNYAVAVPSSDVKPGELQSFSITAHYAGSTTFAASDSPTVKTVP